MCVCVCFFALFLLMGCCCCFFWGGMVLVVVMVVVCVCVRARARAFMCCPCVHSKTTGSDDEWDAELRRLFDAPINTASFTGASERTVYLLRKVMFQ